MATQEADHINGTPVIISLCFTLSLDSWHSFATFIFCKFLIKKIKFFGVHGNFPSLKNLIRFVRDGKYALTPKKIDFF